MINRPRKYLLIPPYPHELSGLSYWKTECRTYSEYNYLKPGIVSKLKRRHFEIALQLTTNKFHKVNVIDFGCGDGFFLPSLTNYFSHVVGIDQQQQNITIASEWVKQLEINNVDLICNQGLTSQELKRELSNKRYDIIFLLEVLEHIGDSDNPKSSNPIRIKFLKEIFELISDNGLIVISIPKMVGMSFLFQRIGLTFFRLHREHISLIDFIKAVLFKDTSKLENSWNGGHIGFNNIEFESYLYEEFNILTKRESLFKSVICITKK